MNVPAANLANVSRPAICKAEDNVTKELSPKRRKRQVYFAESTSVRPINNRHDIDEDTKNRLYCSSTELKKFRMDATKVAQSIFDKETDTCNPRSYSKVFWQTYKSCSMVDNIDDVPTTLTDSVERWAKRSKSRRGLEKWSIPELNEDRKAAKMKAIRLVVRMQSRTVCAFDLSENPDMLARVYQRLSAPAKKYARLLALADAKAADENNKKEQTEKRDDDATKACSHDDKELDDKERDSELVFQGSLPCRQTVPSLIPSATTMHHVLVQ